MPTIYLIIGNYFTLHEINENSISASANFRAPKSQYTSDVLDT